MELFLIIANDVQPLIIITKCSILDDAAVLDPPLNSKQNKHSGLAVRTGWVYITLVSLSESVLSCLRFGGPALQVQYGVTFFKVHS